MTLGKLLQYVDGNMKLIIAAEHEPIGNRIAALEQIARTASEERSKLVAKEQEAKVESEKSPS